MPSIGQHCPFLNRADVRCSDAFSLEKLDHTFEYCFGRYTSCPVYVELLIERRVRRSTAASTDLNDAVHRIIQLKIRRSQARPDSQPLSNASRLPALPGVGARAGG